MSADATDDWKEVFAVGPDLVIGAMLAIPAFITEKAGSTNHHQRVSGLLHDLVTVGQAA